jgi:hypothetical protein
MMEAYRCDQILVAKKAEMFSLAKELGSEAMDDPSLLHPLFARLPPLYPDTPSQPLPPPSALSILGRRPQGDDEDVTPYTPIPLSRLFDLTDELMARYPWDGDVIRGQEIMGEASAVWTYDSEVHASARDMLSMLGGEVVRPGAADMDDNEEEEEPIRPVRRKKTSGYDLRMPRDRLGTSVAIGVMVLGLVLAMYSGRSKGARGEWSGWWGSVIRVWAEKQGAVGADMAGLLNAYRRVSSFVGRALLHVF